MTVHTPPILSALALTHPRPPPPRHLGVGPPSGYCLATAPKCTRLRRASRCYPTPQRRATTLDVGPPSPSPTPSPGAAPSRRPSLLTAPRRQRPLPLSHTPLPASLMLYRHCRPPGASPCTSIPIAAPLFDILRPHIQRPCTIAPHSSIADGAHMLPHPQGLSRCLLPQRTIDELPRGSRRPHSGRICLHQHHTRPGFAQHRSLPSNTCIAARLHYDQPVSLHDIFTNAEHDSPFNPAAKERMRQLNAAFRLPGALSYHDIAGCAATSPFVDDNGDVFLSEGGTLAPPLHTAHDARAAHVAPATHSQHRERPHVPPCTLQASPPAPTLPAPPISGTTHSHTHHGPLIVDDDVDTCHPTHVPDPSADNPYNAHPTWDDTHTHRAKAHRPLFATAHDAHATRAALDAHDPTHGPPPEHTPAQHRAMDASRVRATAHSPQTRRGSSPLPSAPARHPPGGRLQLVMPPQQHRRRREGACRAPPPPLISPTPPPTPHQARPPHPCRRRRGRAHREYLPTSRPCRRCRPPRRLGRRCSPCHHHTPTKPSPSATNPNAGSNHSYTPAAVAPTPEISAAAPTAAAPAT